MSGISNPLEGGFAEPVFEAQSTFRAAMDVLAQPGSIRFVTNGVTPPRPLVCAVGAMLLTLCDFDTSVWLDSRLAAAPDVADWIRVQTGAAIVADPAQANFAFIADPLSMPDLHAFAQGTQEFPDRSATLVLQVANFTGGPELVLEGPGIAGNNRIAPEGLPPDMVERLAANRALFPRGVDIFLAHDGGLIGLPRTTRVSRG